jgi:hypothetical protein
MAEPDFNALFAPEAEPDFTALFAPDEKIPFRPELALKNAPKSAFNTAKRVAADILPGQHVQTGFALAQPGGLSNAWEGLKERFGGVENIKRTAEEDPVGLAYDATGLIGGGKGLSVAKKSTAMPRAVVREEAELLGTGGARMKQAKKSEATVPLADVQAPMQKFRDRLDEEALTIDPQYTNSKLVNVIKRLDTAYAPPKSDPMARMTGSRPAPKPPMTLKELHGHQRRLDDVISESKNPDGRISTDGVIAIELKKSVDEMIDAHPESGSFKIGKHEYHRGKQSQEMSDLFERAQRRAQWRNGDEAAALANEINQYLGKKANRYKFTRAQRAQLAKIGKRDAQALLGAFGSKTVSGMAAGRLVESAFGMPGLLWGPGMMARQARNAKVMDAFKKFQEELRAGGPVGN